MKLKRILAVGTAMLGVSAFVPTPIVQKCVSLVFADESELTSGDFIYRVNKNTNYDWSTGESTTREYVSILRLTDSGGRRHRVPRRDRRHKCRNHRL